MGIEKRKAYIDFLGVEKCQITTLFVQKTLNLEDGDIIDLVTLKKVKWSYDPLDTPPCSFFGIAHILNKNKKEGPKHIILRIYARTNPFKEIDSWGHVSIYENQKNIKGRIYVE